MRPRPAQEPAIRAIEMSEAAFDLKGVPPTDRGSINFLQPPHVVRMYSFGPPKPKLLFQTTPAEIQPELVDIDARPTDIGKPDQHGELVSDPAKEFFSLGQGHLGLLSPQRLFR